MILLLFLTEIPIIAKDKVNNKVKYKEIIVTPYKSKKKARSNPKYFQVDINQEFEDCCFGCPDVEPLCDVESIENSIIYPKELLFAGKEGEVNLRVLIMKDVSEVR